MLKLVILFLAMALAACAPLPSGLPEGVVPYDLRSGEALDARKAARAAGEAYGMTIPELTSLCLQLGLTDALNLDGGGSSTLWTHKAGVINNPCDNRRFDHAGQRRVPNALIIY